MTKPATTQQDAITPQDVLEFWRGAGPDKWYVQDPEFDQEIAVKFGDFWCFVAQGRPPEWCTNPESALAMIILTDQFPRNMFRDDPRAFATDDIAKKTACYAIDRKWDMKIDEPERQFFYMPFMHSEHLCDQDHSVRLFAERMQGGNNLLHARAHRDIIRKFNRFPYRNPALGRETTQGEQDFLDGGGYSETLKLLERNV